MKAHSILLFSIVGLSAFLFSSSRLAFAADLASQGDRASAASYFTVPETELLDTEFSQTRWGGVVERTDSFGGTVLFNFSGLGPSSTGLKDDYPVAKVYGQILPSHGSGDFSNFDGYILWLKNLDATPLSVSLFISTGFTGPSGVPSNDPRNDTFWQSPWTQLQPAEARTLKLEFDNAIPWNINDNPPPHTQGTDGVPMPINDYDRAEVSAIGFQVYTNANPEAPVLLGPGKAPICSLELEADLNNDCKVNFNDLAIMAVYWLDCNLEPQSTCSP